MLLCRVTSSIGDDVLVETNLRSDAVERLTRDDLRAQLGHKALIAIGELDEKVVRSDALDDGIAQELKAFVVDMATILQLHGCRLMNQCEFIQLDIVRYKAEHIVDSGIECPILAEMSA